MSVLPISAFYDNYIWLIINEKENTVLCVDPGDAEPVIHFIREKNLHLKAILLTHHHHDHIGGTHELLNAYPKIRVYGPKDSRIHGVTDPVDDQEILFLESLQLQVLNTPGHTATHISYYEPHYGWLFCGDTLFSAGCGRVFDGTFEELHSSLKKIKMLPDSTQIYCAHEYTYTNLRFATLVEPNNSMIRNYLLQLTQNNNHCSLPSTLAIEKQINPFLRTNQSEVQQYSSKGGTKQTDSLSVFKQLRIDKNNFS